MLQRMRIGQKLVLMGAVCAVALLIVTYQLLSSMRARGTGFTQHELSGLTYQQPLVKLIRDLQTHRGLAASFLRGEAAFEPKLNEAVQHIRADLAAVDEVDSQYGDQLGVAAKWKEIKAHTETALSHWRDSGSAASRPQTDIVHDVLAMVATIGDSSNLASDTNLGSRYLAEATRGAIPELAEVMGQVRALAMGIAAHGGVMREEELKAFRRSSTMVDYYTDRLNADYEKLYASDASLRSRLDDRRVAVNETAASLLRALARELIDAHTATVSPREWWDRATGAVDATYTLYDASAAALRQRLEARLGQSSRQWYVTLALLCIGAAVVAAVAGLIIRDITTPLNEAVHAAERLAVGDLLVSFSGAGRGDELGALGVAFSRMVSTLRVMAAAAERIAAGDLTVEVQPHSPNDVMGMALARMAATLREQLRLILDGIGHLAVANLRISDAMIQAVAGATNTVETVSDGTNIVAAVKETAQLARQRAAAVANSGQQTARIPTAGEKAVQDAVEGMERVRDQTKAIARRVMQLGEQSRAIAQIAGAVSDIADQSDLLSVNAGIEAVRAGAHGKGFTVVAQEVKNLSDRSKRAATQISGILGDIQKAAGDVVAASERATQSAEGGIQQSIDSAEAIRSLAKRLAEASASVAEIAEGSQRQLVDLEQIAAAMDNIRDASRHGVSSVQQIEQAVHELGQISANLQRLATGYTLP